MKTFAQQQDLIRMAGVRMAVTYNDHPKEFYSKMSDDEYRAYCKKAIAGLEKAIESASGGEKMKMQSELKSWKSELATN